MIKQWFSSYQSLFIILLLLVSVLYIFLTKRTSKALNLPPSPQWLPVIGNLLQIGPLIHRSLDALSKKHGPLMLLRLGSFPTLVLQSSQAFQEIIRIHDPDFSNRPIFYASHLFAYKARDIVFCPYGDAWRQSRKICLLHLLSSKMVKELRSIRDEEIAEMVREIDRLIARGSKTVVNINVLLYDLAVNVICTSAAGGKSYVAAYKALLRDAQKLAAQFCFEDVFPWLGWVDGLTGYRANVRHSFGDLDRLLEQIIRDQSEKIAANVKPHRKNFAYALVRLQREGKLDIELDLDNIKGILQSMLAAATDTVPSNMEWAMAELLRHPNVLRKAQEEVRRVVGSGKERVEESEIEQMKYLKSVIKESLRLHGSGIYTRETSKDIKLCGYDIPAKTRVIINNWASHRDPTIWENPEEFIPERWVSCMDGEEMKGKYIPFGFGRRICPGMNYAVAMMETLVANLLYLYDWELPEGVTPDNMDVSEKFAQAIHLKHPLMLVPLKP
ncbi:PREDICTED: cytochrome P450 71A1-like [Tarenaya hassleriana]|uniref:cytochrome P450 71A1-like n=1 Tax=Tarenaya hassleriana TaxID=28532 RepID=UPI00053CA473|nr:PREDICTED: cytochrome P450 71A1-like [Tarenaya hassleriana]